MAAAAIFEKFQMAISPQPVVYLRNGSRSTYIARIARFIFAIAQLSCCHLGLKSIWSAGKPFRAFTTLSVNKLDLTEMILWGALVQNQKTQKKYIKVHIINNSNNNNADNI